MSVLHGNACPAGCGRPVKPGHLMCGRCWREVPKHLQTDVWRTWRAYRRTVEQGPPGELGGKRDAYHAARDAAVGSIQ